MTLISVEVGQCGIQVGSAFWKIMDASLDVLDRPTQLQGLHSIAGSLGRDWDWARGFLREGRQGQQTARCIVVDSDPRQVLHRPAICRNFAPIGHSVVGKGCSGKNWAQGYRHANGNMLWEVKPQSRRIQKAAKWTADMRDPTSACDGELLEIFVEALRKETEACDGIPEFLIWHSMGGGAGGGVGSGVLEAIRCDFPRNYIGTISIAPLLAGFEPMQKVNTAMTMSWLQTYADVVMLFQTDRVLASLASKQNCGARGLHDDSVNWEISKHVASVLWPLDEVEGLRGKTVMSDVVMHVCPDPGMKFTEVSMASSSQRLATDSPRGWRKLIREAFHGLGKGSHQGTQQPIVSSASMVIGRASAQRPPSIQQGAKAFQQCAKCLSHSGLRRPPQAAEAVSVGALGRDKSRQLGLLLRDECQRHCQGAASLFGATESVQTRGSTLAPSFGEHAVRGINPTKERQKPRESPCSVAIVSNRFNVADFSMSLSKAVTRLCDTGAYMHWYEINGCSRDAVREACRSLEDLADRYGQSHFLSHTNGAPTR
eukprot:evm.model.scf_1471.1 EVM.evm.TU.scf_1471.1   scf_1471:4595-10308(-)